MSTLNSPGIWDDFRHIDRGGELKRAFTEAKKGLAYLPSEYGELKITGPLRFDRSNWAGAMIDPAAFPVEERKVLRELLSGRGIPSVEMPFERTTRGQGVDDIAMARLMSERALGWKD